MSRDRLTLSHANAIIDLAMAHGRALGLKPLSVAVLDAGGHLVTFARADGSSNLRPQIAMGKAYGALALGVSSRAIGEMAVERPTFVAALGAIAPGGLVPAAGGVLIHAQDGSVLGAAGVTGDTSDNDEACAMRGIEGAGLIAG